MVARALDTNMKRVIAGVVALLIAALGVAMAFGGGGAEAAAPTTEPDTTTTAAPTTTEPQSVAPLTGVSDGYGELLDRPALMVKVDNHVEARPQAGLNQADIVIEERVEGNITRLAAIFHSQDADPVGPVRSTRSTDIDLAALLGRPLYASSGGNDHVLGELRRANVVDVGHNRGGAGFWREGGRRGPHNLMASTVALRARSDEALAAPAPVFQYRTAGEALAPGAVPAGGVALSFGGAEVSRFGWDPDSKTWLRSQSGAAHLDAAGQQVAPKNVVVMEIAYSFSGVSKPHGITTGEGRALVFTDGHLIEGRWVRPGPASPLQLLAADGTPIKLTAGQTFLELPPAGGSTVL